MSEPKIICKFLPAKGEIKRGDYNMQTDYSTRSSGKPVVGIWDDDKPPVNSQFMKFQRVERFAVTTEFAVGDQVQRHDSIKPITIDGKVNTVEMLDDSWFKILAPLSPNVTWEILDGAEIEVSKRIFVKHEDDSSWHKPMGGLPHKQEKVFMEVKGPCGHYH